MSLSPVGREEKYVPFSWYASWLASPTPSATRPLSWRSLRTLADRLSGTKNVTVLRSGCTTAPITQAWAGRSCASRVPTCMNAGPCRSSTTLSGIMAIRSGGEALHFIEEEEIGNLVSDEHVCHVQDLLGRVERSTRSGRAPGRRIREA